MKNICFAAIAVLIALSTGASPPGSQGKKPPARPHIRSSAAPPVKGTAQIPGDNGKLDQVYTMGVGEPHNFTLRSAEYTLGRLVIGTSFHAPTKDQKLLLLKFTVQNPNKREALLRFDTFKLTAVDSQDINHDGIGDIVQADEDQTPLNLNLKPGQRVEVLTGILVPAEASVPKLMVQHRSGGKVLRYDLRGLVKPLPAPFADPADSTGARARGDIPGEKEVFYALEHFDVKYVSSASTAEKLGSYAPGAGNQFFIATLTLRNSTHSKQHYRFDTLRVRLIDADGEKEDNLQTTLLKTSRNEAADNQLEPGESYTCRLIVKVPKEIKQTKLALYEGESHPYVFDLRDSR